MPRANRYFLPGHLWHVTHRCHKREFLLKFARDRRRWVQWLFEARKRFGLTVLNYTVTSNHIHLLLFGGSDRMAIPRAMQLVAGRVAQEYNLRKKRRGAYWEDRYHATAVESCEHFKRCLMYLDLNMVRASVVSHPAEWAHGGFHEILEPPRRYQIIDRVRLVGLLGLPGVASLGARYKEAVDQACEQAHMLKRQPEWSEAVGVGSPAYLEALRTELGLRGRHRTVHGTSDVAGKVLSEPSASYEADFEGEMGILSTQNAIKWKLTG